MAILIDSYSESNQSSYISCFSGGNQFHGMSFTNINAIILDSCKFYIEKVGLPTGNITAKLYAHTGTYGSSSIPTGSALATSDNFDISTLTTSLQVITFNFSGANRISLSANTKYVIVITVSDATTSSGNMLYVGTDNTSPTAPGNRSYSPNGSSWTAATTHDICFYVYGAAPPPIAPTSAHTDSKTETEIVMHWTDNSADETGFKMYKNDIYIETIAANSVSYTFTGLTANTQYDLAVKATNANGDSVEAQLTVTTMVASFTITFDSQGGTPTPSPITGIISGATVTLPAAPTKTGYTFGGWWTGTGGSGTQFTASTPVTANITVYAKWVSNTYTVTFNSNGGGTPSPASKSVTYASTYGTLATITRTGYTFNGWFTAASGGTQITSATTVSITAAQTLYAHWTINQFTATFKNWDGAVLSTSTVDYNTAATAPSNPTRTRYTFTGWDVSFSNMIADITVTAVFTINTYTLTYSAGANGTLTGVTTQVVNYGASGSTVTAVPNAHYHFVQWSDGVLTATRTDASVSGNITVTATFAINTYTLTYTAGANGIVTGTTPQTVNYGANGALITAVPNVNYRFDSWSDGVLTVMRTDTNVTDNITVTANFVIILYTYTVCLPLERGQHIVSVQASDSVGTVSTDPITYVMAYELASYGIDIYSGDAKLDVIEPVLHDALLPDLPTLNFSCATLLTGTIRAVIRERGLRQYQFTIDTVGISGGIYSYTCLAAESYDLTTAIMTLQTAYGPTSDAIATIAPSLNIMGANLLTQMTYPQLFAKIEPLEVIKQLLIQALAQASVRNGNMYVFPLDVSAQVPDYHMQRLDPLTGWQRDADIYNAVEAHYIVKQYPTPATVLTLNDAANWTGTVTDVTQVADTLLPVPSGALGMLKSIGNCSRVALSVLFRDMDRVRFNWCPVTATALTVSLQQDVDNKLEMVHAFSGQIGAGFLLAGSPGVSTDTVTKDITLSPVQYVTTVAGTMTAGCSYRVTLLNAGGATLWQDAWRSTIGNTFEAAVPANVSQVNQVTTIRIEFTSLYLIGSNYGIQCVTCYITVQTRVSTGSHQQVVSTTQYGLRWDRDNTVGGYTSPLSLPPLVAYQRWYPTWEQVFGVAPWMKGISSRGFTSCVICPDYGAGPFYSHVTVVLKETVTDYVWVPSTYVWSSAFNLFESVDLAFVDMVRTGNPVNLQSIVLTFSGDNYVDSLILMADNPLPVVVRAGTGSRAYVVTDDFGSQAGAQAYADGLLPIISVAREQYTRDVSLATDLSVGDTVYGDENIFTINAIDYRQDSKTLSAGRSMDILKTQLREQARRLDALERKV